MPIKLNFPLFILLFLTVHSFSLQAQETQVMVRAKAKDAKFIASSVGGAKIILTDVETGALLAEGITYGTTGNTEVIMKSDHRRRKNLSDEHTAGFLAKLQIEEPTLINVEAQAPLKAGQAKITANTQVWVIPGKDILGDGIVLEIPGFIVDILSPQRHSTHEKGTEIEIIANVVMMCGCPTEPGGIWNADDYEIRAIFTKEGEKIKEIPMEFAGKTNTFKGKTHLDPGFYAITLYAYDKTTGNTGVDKTTIIVK